MLRRSIVACVLAAGLVIAGCGKKPETPVKQGETPKPAAEKPVKLVIGVLLPTSGPDAAKGQAVLAGLKLAIKQKGAAVGLNDASLELADCGKPGSDEAALARTLVNVEGAGVLIGPLDEKGVNDVDDLGREKSVPILTTASGALKLSPVDCTVRRLTFTDGEEGAAMAELAAKKGRREAAIFVDTASPASESRAKSFTERFQRLDGHVVSQVAYSKGDTSFSRLVHMVVPAKGEASQKPDLFYLPGGRAECAAILEEMKAQKVLGDVLGSSDWVDGEFPTDVAAGAGIYVPARFFAVPANAASVAFASAFAGETKREPAAFDAMGYDAGLVIIEALNRNAEFAESVGKTKLLWGVTGKLTARDGSLASQIAILRLKGKAFEYDSTAEIK